MDIKSLVKQHILTILCILALVALMLPFLSVTAEVESSFVTSDASTTTSGFDAIQKVFLGWGLVLGPVLLIAMNYIKKLEKYKGILAIIVPIVCLVIEVITFFQAKGISASASGGNAFVSMEVNASLGIGFFVLILVYLGMIVAGAVLYHNFTLDKAGLERLKTEGADLFGSGFDKLKEASANIINSSDEKGSNVQSNEGSAISGNDSQKPIKKSTNHNKTQETLSLIEKLASMRDSGILTEEEFQAKKQQLLEEI